MIARRVLMILLLATGCGPGKADPPKAADSVRVRTDSAGSRDTTAAKPRGCFE